MAHPQAYEKSGGRELRTALIKIKKCALKFKGATSTINEDTASCGASSDIIQFDRSYLWVVVARSIDGRAAMINGLGAGGWNRQWYSCGYLIYAGPLRSWTASCRLPN